MIATATPWSPPPPPKETPTALPVPTPQKTASVLAFLVWPHIPSDSSPNNAPSLYRIGISANGEFDETAEEWRLSGDTLPGAAELHASSDGHYLASVDETEGGSAIYVFDAITNRLVTVLTPGKFFGWHPDHRNVLFYQDLTNERGLWLYDLDTKDHRLIAQPRTIDITGAAISPEGQVLAYGSNTFDKHQIYLANADGSESRLVIDSPEVVAVWGWSHDGGLLAYTGESVIPSKETGSAEAFMGSIWVMDRKGENRRPLQGPFVFGYGFRPIWSPSENKLIFVGSEKLDDCWSRDDSFRADPLCRFRGSAVYIEDVDTGELHLIADNAIDPSWSPDGNFIAYVAIGDDEKVGLWIYDRNNEEHKKITVSGDYIKFPIWLQMKN